MGVNVEKYGRDRQATDNNKCAAGKIRFACRVSKASVVYTCIDCNPTLLKFLLTFEIFYNPCFKFVATLFHISATPTHERVLSLRCGNLVHALQRIACVITR
jgi:hypothetical protein